MPEGSSNKLPRSRASDFGHFLRGMGHRAPEHQNVDSGDGTSVLEVPAESPVRRRKSSLIPFLGRSRKRSTDASTSAPKRSVDASSLMTFRTSTASYAPDTAPSKPLASRFSPPRVKRGRSRRSTTPTPGDRQLGYMSDSHLQPPSACRSSTDSSKTQRSLRGAASHPTITVSPSPEPPEDHFQDLFTKPGGRSGDSSANGKRRPPPLFSVPPRHEPDHGETLPDSPVSTMSPPISPSLASPDFSRGSSTSTGDDTDEVSMLSVATSVKSERRRSAGSMRRTSVHPAPPPKIPLPDTPSSSATARTPTQKQSNSSLRSKQKSLTLSSRASVTPTTPTPPKLYQSSSSSERQSTSFEKRHSKEQHVAEAFDMYTASIDTLRQALQSRTKQLDDLAQYLLKVTQDNVTTKNALEKRIATLESELSSRDQEIMSLRSLLSGGRPTTGVATVGPRTDTPPQFPPSSFPYTTTTRRTRSDTEDSGNETRTESGAESSSSLHLHKTKTEASHIPRRNLSLRLGRFRSDQAPLSDATHAGRSSERRVSISSSGASEASSPVPSNPALTPIPEAQNAARTSRSSSSASSRAKSSTSSRDPAIAAAISSQRTPRRIPSTTRPPTSKPGSPTPAAAYAATLRHPRTQSIGQVLESQPRLLRKAPQ
ncbi:hypothetical protein CYLTODRAFT_490043 [Cylindrobasidium torrendii FP15055 ss-10]|uniref:Uncharacterized protein n=1 Tax=Cylindrobasidium torrendii FP15055 ss-10 TaxID=1314674 RepID=A0A0D7BD21_9AGAR|nr:hypothetical protein CYLTODRAFT_490043 [Cylindrobasidium torrendii FP15055 ss-10]